MVALPCCDVRQGVLDLDAFTKQLTAGAGLLKTTEAFLESFVLGNRDRTAAARGCRRALGPLGARSACIISDSTCSVLQCHD